MPAAPRRSTWAAPRLPAREDTLRNRSATLACPPAHLASQPGPVSAVLALCSSLLWGTADFLGGTSSRRISTYAVIGASQGMALVGVLVVAVATGSFGDPLGYLPWALAAGAVGLIALSAFYTALARGTMGVVAPIAATGVVVPVAVGLARGESPSALQFAGAAVTILGVVLASGPEIRHGASMHPIWLAFVAAAGFGGALVFIAEGSATSVVMTLVGARIVPVLVLGALAAVAGHLGGVRRVDVPILAVIGAFDIGANATYGVATHSGLVSLTAVLASLYPAVTVVLARQVHHERMRRIQDAGVAMTILGVILLTVGGGAG